MKITIGRLTDITLYIALITLAIWIIGKSLGLIQSPAWVEMIPYGAAVFGAGAFYQKVTRMGTDLKEVSEKVGTDLKEVSVKVNNIDSKVIRIQAKLEDKILKPIDGFEKKPAEEKR